MIMTTGHIVRIFIDTERDGVRRRQGLVDGFEGSFTYISPERRKRTSALVCPIGGEITRDYWYCHNTGRQGDVKLCRVHQVIEQIQP